MPKLASSKGHLTRKEGRIVAFHPHFDVQAVNHPSDIPKGETKLYVMGNLIETEVPILLVTAMAEMSDASAQLQMNRLIRAPFI